MEEIRITTPDKKRIPLNEIANYSIKRGEVSINHLDGSREIQVNANLLDPAGSASDIVFSIQESIIPILKDKYPNRNLFCNYTGDISIRAMSQAVSKFF